MAGRADADLDREHSRSGTGHASLDPASRPGEDASVADANATVAYHGRVANAEHEAAGDPPLERSGIGAAGHRFEVIRAHATGGLGEIFVALDRELNRSVALKVLPANQAHDPSAQARFLLEAQVTGRLEHPGIVPVYSLGRYDDGRPYYAMHLVEGETLARAIERFHQKELSIDDDSGRALAFRRLLRSVIDACNAVAFAHSRGVIHRDLKPENIMLGRFGETFVVDWGLAKVIGEPQVATDSSAPRDLSPADASMTQPGSLLGTPRYVSPEQAAGELDRVTPASDIYSLGAILYCVLVGHGPFPDGDLPSVLGRAARGIFPAPRRLLRSVDPALESICLKAMSRSPDERYTTALDLAKALETWLADVRYRGEQEVALSQTKSTLARLCLERANNYFVKNAHAEGLLWLARALENAPENPDDLDRVIRTSLTGWHSATKLLERTLRHGAEVHALAFCPEARRLATAGADGVARLWDVATASLLATPLAHDGPVHHVAFSPDGKFIATAALDDTIKRWDAWTGEPQGESIRTRETRSLAFSPDGSMLAAVNATGQPFVWHTASGKAAFSAAGNRSPLKALAFHPDGSRIAMAHGDGRVSFHEAATGKALGEPLSHSSSVRVLVFDGGGTRLLTGGLDGEVRLWDLATSQMLVTLSHQGEIQLLAFRPGGEAFATVCGDGSARLWETATGRPIGEPLVQGSRVDCVAFHPDGMILATGSPDGMVRLYCAITGLAVGPPLVQGGAIRALAFGPDGRRLATAGTDMAVRCWKLPVPVEGTPERISCWVGVTTELEFDAGDAVRRMGGTTSWDLRRRLSELGGAPLR